MTESIRSINVVVRLDFKGHDVSNINMAEAIDNMEYSFSFNDNYLRIVNTEIVDAYVPEGT